MYMGGACSPVNCSDETYLTNNFFLRKWLPFRVRACSGKGMQPSELLRCELGEVTTGETIKGHPGSTRNTPGGTNRKRGSNFEMGGTRCQEDDPGRDR